MFQTLCSKFMHACMLSHFSVQLSATLWTAACQAPLSIGFSRRKYWSGLSSPPPKDLPIQESNLCLLSLLHWQVGSLPLAPPGKHVVNLYCFTNGINKNFISLKKILGLNPEYHTPEFLPLDLSHVNKTTSLLSYKYSGSTFCSLWCY